MLEDFTAEELPARQDRTERNPLCSPAAAYRLASEITALILPLREVQESLHACRYAEAHRRLASLAAEPSGLKTQKLTLNTN